MNWKKINLTIKLKTMNPTITQRSIKDTIKMFRTIKESGNVFSIEQNNIKTDFFIKVDCEFVLCNDGEDISLLYLFLEDGETRQKIPFKPTDSDIREMLGVMYKWIEDEKKYQLTKLN